MPKKSQRKGRAGEIEIKNILKAAGWDAAVTGIYDTLDVLWGYDGRDHLCEVKRRKNIMKWAYDAFKAGASACFVRADNQHWLIVMPMAEFIQTYGPRYPLKDATLPADGKNGETPIMDQIPDYGPVEPS